MNEISIEVIRILKSKLKELGIDLNSSSPWTVYSAIIARNKTSSELELISFGSGIRCLPDKLIEGHRDSLVHDMHAEVLCRRAFNSFVFQNLTDILKNNVIDHKYLKLDQSSGKYYWNEEQDLIFYTSQSPCKLLFLSKQSINF
jgi:tRNA-specific adenosine deaminase 1